MKRGLIFLSGFSAKRNIVVQLQQIKAGQDVRAFGGQFGNRTEHTFLGLDAVGATRLIIS